MKNHPKTIGYFPRPRDEAEKKRRGICGTCGHHPNSKEHKEKCMKPKATLGGLRGGE